MALLVSLSECDDHDKEAFDHNGFGTESWISLQVRLKELMKAAHE